MTLYLIQLMEFIKNHYKFQKQYDIYIKYYFQYQIKYEELKFLIMVMFIIKKIVLFNFIFQIFL